MRAEGREFYLVWCITPAAAGNQLMMRRRGLVCRRGIVVNVIWRAGCRGVVSAGQSTPVQGRELVIGGRRGTVQVLGT